MADPAGVLAVIFDWAGTVVDFGSRAPMGAFVRAFAACGVAITIEDARAPMGLPKRAHIQQVLDSARVRAAWETAHGHAPDAAAVDRIFTVFEPMNAASVAEHADFIPGALDTINALRARGIRIGSTTGYTRPIMDVLAPIARAGGYDPEVIVCAGDLPAGRPSPLMMWHAMAALGVWPARRVVKVDDTVPGIAEGTAAGTWTVGVTLSGNAAGLSQAELAALSLGEQAALRNRIEAEMIAAGADLVIDSIADLGQAITVIEYRLARGIGPGDGH
jgi:phosphonoacetaldehyde hydrolase